MRHKTLCCIYV